MDYFLSLIQVTKYRNDLIIKGNFTAEGAEKYSAEDAKIEKLYFSDFEIGWIGVIPVLTKLISYKRPFTAEGAEKYSAEDAKIGQ